MNHDITAVIRTAAVTPDQLRGGGIGVRHLTPTVIRLRAEIEPEPDGTPAVGLYMDAWDESVGWVCQSEGWADTADDATAIQVRLGRIMHTLDLYYAPWLSYHGAAADDGHGWVWLFTAARAVELGYDTTRTAGRPPAGTKTVSELARLSGLAENTVRRYLNGHEGLGVAKWARLARAMGIRLSVC